ncbi:hypothetical protein EV181_006395, partial [Coemansia sp. RSA 532]
MTGDETIEMAAGERVVQLVPMKIEQPAITVVDTLPETEHGAGGFGSSGVGELASLRIAAASTVRVELNKDPTSSYEDDARLRRVWRKLETESLSEAETKTLRKYHVRNGFLYKRGRRCIAQRKE